MIDRPERNHESSGRSPVRAGEVRKVRVWSPRLAEPERAADFVMIVGEEYSGGSGNQAQGNIMSTWGVVVLRFQQHPDHVDINIWRRDLLTDFGPGYFLDPLMVIRDAGSGPIPIEDGSVWVDVGVYRDYYGVGYERGDAEWFIRLAEWLERTVPGCEVWYGNDSSDESIRPFGPSERAALLAYFQRVGHEPYRKHFRQGQDT